MHKEGVPRDWLIWTGECFEEGGEGVSMALPNSLGLKEREEN